MKFNIARFTARRAVHLLIALMVVGAPVGYSADPPPPNNGSNNNNSGNNNSNRPSNTGTRPSNTGNNNNNSNTSNNQQNSQSGNQTETRRQRNRRTREEEEKKKQEEQKAGQPAAAAKPAEPAKGAPAAAASKPKSTVPSLGEFKSTVSALTSILRVHPEGAKDRQDIYTTVGEEFTTEVTFDNKSLDPFDSLRILLSFDPDLLEPLAINDSVLAKRIDGMPTAEVDPLYGVILYEAKMKEPVSLNDAPLLSVRWKSKKTTVATRIEFSSREELYTVVANKEKDLLGDARVPNDGTLNMEVTILPEDQREAEAMLNDPSVFQGGESKVGGAKLFIRPPAETPVAGKPFYFDIVLDNRALSNIDGVTLLMSFDPEVLDIIDADLDNYITRELNILDGPFHKDFPWSYHIDNIVYQTRGLMSYRVGTSDADIARGKQGTLARVYAVANRPTAGTPIVFRFTRSARDHGTALTFNGLDCLGAPDVFADGTQGASIRVLPALAEEVVAGLGGN